MFKNSRQLRKQCAKVVPKNTKVGLMSMLIAFISAFIISVISYLIMFCFGEQSYSDIISGNITALGLCKDIDFYTYYIFLVVFFISFLLSNYFLNNKFNEYEEQSDRLQPIHYIVAAILPAIFLLFKLTTVSRLIAAFFLFICFMGYLLKILNIQNKYVGKILCSFFYIYLSASGLLALLTYVAPTMADKITPYFMGLLWMLLIVLGSAIYMVAKRRQETAMNSIAVSVNKLTQLLIPLCLFSLINTRYIFNGNFVTIENYSKFCYLVILIIVLLIIINMNAIFSRKKQSSVWLTTLITLVATCAWNTYYSLQIITDQFHTGETAIVYDQVMVHAQRWNKDFVSTLQGLGFLVSGLNEWIFGGTFSTFWITQNLYMVIIAVLVTIALYFLVEHKWMILLYAPVMPLFFMDRTYLLPLTFFILLNSALIKKPFVWTYVYIATCVINVWYQPSYGGAISAAFLPALALIWYRAYKESRLFNFKDRKALIRMSAFIGSVVVIGLCCIPLLVDALHFLRMNGAGTNIGNGISVAQTVRYEIVSFAGRITADYIVQFCYKYGGGLFACILMLYYFITYVIKERNTERFVQGIILTISAPISYFLILPAILTRVDPGHSRIGVTNMIYFGGLALLLLYTYRQSVKRKALCLFVAGVLCTAPIYFSSFPYFSVHQKANATVTVPSSATYVTPEQTGLPKLGYAYVEDINYVNEAMVLKEVCDLLLTPEQTYYDYTDKAIYYNYVNRPVPGLYVSAMIAANEEMQTAAIERLSRDDVPIVFINKPLSMIGADSLRSYRIYRYLMEQEYQFIRYKDTDFLVHKDLDLAPIANQLQGIDARQHIGVYDDQVNSSVYDDFEIAKMVVDEITYFNSIENVQGRMKIAGPDPFVAFKPTAGIPLSKVKLVEITFENAMPKGTRGQLFISTAKTPSSENNSLRFSMESSRLLLPLYQLSQFGADDEFTELRLDFDEIANNQDVTIKQIVLYELDEVGIIAYEEEVERMLSAVPDYRLDEAFHPMHLAQLPIEWGRNFKNMSDRFTTVLHTDVGLGQYSVENSAVTTTIALPRSLQAGEADFLRIQLDCSEKKFKGDATLLVHGIDGNGKPFVEEFMFAIEDSTLLIPIGTSPNCIRAQSIDTFELVFNPQNTPYAVSIDEVELYRLTK